MKQLALIEDDQRLLKRMAVFLNNQPELKCVIAARSLGDFFERLDEGVRLDLLLLDIELSNEINTINHLQKIKNLLPSIKVLVITGHNHPDYVLKAVQQGADSFFLKGSGLPRLLEAIDSTLSGGAYFDPAAAAHMIPYLRGRKEPVAKGISISDGRKTAPSEGAPAQTGPQLSQREEQVARGLMQGQSYKEIAENINLSINTIRHYVKVLYKKFGVANKIQLSNKLKNHM